MRNLEKEEILFYLSGNKKFFCEEFGLTKLGIFGSFARNEATEKSDIDIIIEMPRGTRNIFEKKRKFRKLLQKHFHRRIDICRESAIKPLFRELILKDVIYV